MFLYTIVGLFVIVAILAAGVFWLFSNVTFKRTPQRYTYMVDEEGNAVVKDTTDA